MTEAAKKLFEEAMKLPPEERSRLAHQLLESTIANDDMGAEERAELLKAIEDAEQDIDAGRVVDEADVEETWREEVRVRLAKIHSGEAKLTPWEQAERRLFAK